MLKKKKNILQEFLFRTLFGAAIEEDEEDETAAAARQQKLPVGNIFGKMFFWSGIFANH